MHKSGRKWGWIWCCWRPRYIYVYASSSDSRVFFFFNLFATQTQTLTHTPFDFRFQFGHKRRRQFFFFFFSFFFDTKFMFSISRLISTSLWPTTTCFTRFLCDWNSFSVFTIFDCELYCVCGKFSHLYAHSHTSTPGTPCWSPTRVLVWVSYTHIYTGKLKCDRRKRTIEHINEPISFRVSVLWGWKQLF